MKWYDNIVEYIDGIIFFAKEMMKFDDYVLHDLREANSTVYNCSSCCDLFGRMTDDDGPWYGGLFDEWDKEHRARAIEKGQVRSKTGSIFVISHLCSCIDY